MMQDSNLVNFTDILCDVDEIANSQPISLPSSPDNNFMAPQITDQPGYEKIVIRPAKHTGQYGDFRSIEEIEPIYRDIFSYPYFNLIQSRVIEDGLYSDKSLVVCAPTGSGKTVVFEMAIVQLLMSLDEKNYTGDFKIIYMAPVKALCTERLSEWYPKFTKLGLMCIEVTGDTNVDFSQLKPYRIIITTPEKWDMLTRRWRDHRSLVEVIKLFLIDEVHILNEETRGPVLEAVVSRMKTIESSSQTVHRIEHLQKQYQDNIEHVDLTTIPSAPRIRFVAVSATVSNPDDVAAWLGTKEKPAVFYKFGDECRPVALKRIVEGYPCPDGMSIFKFDIILNYKLWPIIQKYHDGKPTLIFCNTRKSVALTAETLSKELTISFTPEQKAKLTAVACKIKNKKLQALVMNGVGCHHAGLLFEERLCIEEAFRNRDLPILITTTTLAMGVNLPAHLVIIKNTQQYVNGAYQEYSITTVLQMVGRAGRPQFDTEATAVIMTRSADKLRYQALVGGSEPLQSYLHRRMAENLNSEAALGTVSDVAQCVQWLRSTFLYVRAAKEPRRYLGLAPNAPTALISKKIEELCVKAMNGLASAGLITMDEACCIASTEAGRLMSIFYLDLETMKQIMKIEGDETLERILWVVCESHELADMHLRVDERRTLNALNRNNAAATIRFPMKGKISTRQMKVNCIIQAVLGCLPIPDPSLNQEAMKVIRIATRVCKCLVAYVTRPDLISTQPKYYSTVLNTLILAKCIEACLWENSPYVSKQLKGIGPTFSTLLATAGKVNFTLLEESHPRDLERIMNKGAPAGNVLRKQVGLLPKYQLTATPIDEKRVSIQLTLLNQHHLAENRDQLTAEDSHKCHVVIGDSENHLLYFTTFRDSDLISIYDGVLTYEVTRKHNFEHKIMAHCVSSNWVGIDAQCDYVFKNIELIFSRGEPFNNTHAPNTQNINYTNIPTKQVPKKQTCITDIYKSRKRKNNDTDVTQSKEKKKRESALVEKFKCLKNSFEITTKEIIEDLSNSAIKSNEIFYDMTQARKGESRRCEDAENKNTDDNLVRTNPSAVMSSKETKNIKELDCFKMDQDLDEDDNFLIDDRINSIMNEIESEIYKTNKERETFNCTKIDNSKTVNLCKKESNNTELSSLFFAKSSVNDNQVETLNSNPYKNIMNLKSINENRKRKYVNKRSNFSFIDSLNKSSDENEIVAPKKETGFTEAIKNQVEQFLKKTTKDNNKDNVLSRVIHIAKPNNEVLSHSKSETQAMENNLNKLLDVKNVSKNSSLQLIDGCINVINKDECKKNLEKILEKNHVKEKKTVMKGNKDCIPSTDIADETYVSCFSGKEFNYIPARFDNRANIQKCSGDMNSEIVCQRNIYINGDNDVTGAETIDGRYNKVVEVYEDSNKEDKVTVQQTPADDSNNVKDEKEMNTIVPFGYFLKCSDNEEELNPTISLLYQSRMPENIRPLTETMPSLKKIDNSSTSLVHKPISIGFKPVKSKVLNKQHNIITQSADQRSMNSFNKEIDLNQLHTAATDNMLLRTMAKSHVHGAEFTTAMFNEETARDFQNHHNQSQVIEKYSDVEYIDRYSFTATKINVCTNNTTDHNVQIISKLKLDLDITKIVSKVNKDNLNKEKSFVNQKQHKDSTCSSFLRPPAYYNPEPQHIKNKPRKTTDLNITDIQSVIGAIPFYKDYNNLVTLKKATKPICSESESNLIADVSKDSSRYVEFDTNTNDNKVENILKKYSTILRKQGHSDIDRKHHQDIIKDQVTVKAKRPFKISDIHKSEIALPETLIRKSPNVRQINDYVLRQKNQIDEKNNIEEYRNVTPPKTLGFTQKSQVVDNTDVNFIANVDIPEQVSPEPLLTETEPLQDLDQSMFNPKTLLQQCFSIEESEVILPPPTGFENEKSVYSPTHFENDSFMPSYLYSENNSEDVEFTSEFNQRNISQDDISVLSVLTPSKEINDIETWTSSQEDVSKQSSRFQWDSMKNTSYPTNTNSVIRNYTFLNRGLSSLKNDTYNSKEKLGKFKLMHKKKLKM